MDTQNIDTAFDLAEKIAETQSGLVGNFLAFEFYVGLGELRLTLPKIEIEGAYSLAKYLNSKGWPEAANPIRAVTSVLIKPETPQWAVTVLDLNHVKGNELQERLDGLLQMLRNYGVRLS